MLRSVQPGRLLGSSRRSSAGTSRDGVLQDLDAVATSVPSSYTGGPCSLNRCNLRVGVLLLVVTHRKGNSRNLHCKASQKLEDW